MIVTLVPPPLGGAGRAASPMRGVLQANAVPNKIFIFSGFSIDSEPILGIIREQQTREGEAMKISNVIWFFFVFFLVCYPIIASISALTGIDIETVGELFSHVIITIFCIGTIGLFFVGILLGGSNE